MQNFQGTFENVSDHLLVFYMTVPLSKLKDPLTQEVKPWSRL